jgi:hypothetical protein
VVALLSDDGSGDVVAFDAGEADSAGSMTTVRAEVAARPAVSGVGLVVGAVGRESVTDTGGLRAAKQVRHDTRLTR